ncbi:MAG: YfcE family phosphodiesterase [Clostridiales bacterium]|nr:YfcE family phosphodiesterase [Clostridiales bacterium]
MKILVFADFHGSVSGLQQAIEISKREHPDKTVVCGDLFGWNNPKDAAELVSKLDGVLYLVKGNNDYATAQSFLPCEMEDNAIMYHFGRKLFFTHGDRYNSMRIPPLLQEGDALIHGHSHVGRLRLYNGLYVANVGSLSRPRDGTPNYVTIDEQGIILKLANGEILQQLNWD